MIVFDSLGTLFSLRVPARRLDEAAGKGAFKEWHARVLRDGFALAASGRFSTFEEVALAQLECFLRERGVRARASVAREVLAAFGELEAYPDLGPALEEGRAAGARMLALTNGSLSLTKRLLERAGALSFIEIVISIDDVGAWKPAPEIYQAAAGRIGLAPREIGLLTGHAWDVQGALAAGLRAGFVAREEPFYPGSMPEPDFYADSLTEGVRAMLKPGLAARVRQLLAGR